MSEFDFLINDVRVWFVAAVSILLIAYLFVDINKNILAVKNIYQNISNHYTFAYYLTLFILLLLVFLFLVVFSIGLQSMGGSVGGGDVIFWSYLYLSPAVYLYFIFYSWGYHRQNIIKLIPLTFLGLSPIFWFFI